MANRYNDSPKDIEHCLSCTRPFCDGGRDHCDYFNRRRFRGKKYEFGGESRTVRDWCNIAGISRGSFITWCVGQGIHPRVVRKHMPGSGSNQHREKKHQLYGEMVTLSEVSEKYHYARSALNYHLKKGKTLEEIINRERMEDV